MQHLLERTHHGYGFKLAVGLPYIVLGLMLVLFEVLPTPEGVWLYVPLLSSVIFLGLPHGAVDHIVLLKLNDKAYSLRATCSVVVPYLALAAAYLIVWMYAPTLAFFGFILLTWFHWGQGDVHTLVVTVRAKHLHLSLLRLFALVVRGGLPMLVPLLFFPDVYQAVFIDITAMFAYAPFIDSLTVVFTPAFSMWAGGGYFLLVSLYVLLSLRALQWVPSRAFWLDIGEVVLLFFFFARIHPLVAIAAYFCCWHAARHIVRVVMFEEAGHNPDAFSTEGLKKFMLQALPTTLIALAGLWLLYTLVPNVPHTVAGWTSLYLVLIAVLTLPHVWVVLRMDIVEGVWRS